MNTHPLHFDAAYAARSEFGRVVVNSCLTLSIVAGMSVSDISQKAIANLGWTDIRLIAPVFAGDTIYAESEVLSKRESAKRPSQGIVTIRTTGRKADGRTNAPCSCRSAAMPWTTQPGIKKPFQRNRS
jgi:itaconyl-CoA hydratase